MSNRNPSLQCELEIPSWEEEFFEYEPSYLRQITRYPGRLGVDDYDIDISPLAEVGVGGRGFLSLLLFPGYLALSFHSRTHEEMVSFPMGKFEVGNEVDITLPVLGFSEDARSVLRSVAVSRLGSGTALSARSLLKGIDTIELDTPLVVGGTGEAVGAPSNDKTNLAVANRIVKHAVTLQSIGSRPGYVDLRVYGVGGYGIGLLLHVALRGPIVHKKYLWRFSPAAISLVHKNEEVAVGKGKVCRGWEVEVGYKLRSGSENKNQKRQLQEVTCCENSP